MSIPKHIEDKLNRLYSDHFLGFEEISALEEWIQQVESDAKMTQWLLSSWEVAVNADVEISFEEIRRRIRQNGSRAKNDQFRRIYVAVQKVAAILVIPLLLMIIWLFVDRQPESLKMTLATARGERTHIYLPDSSEVWLNVDSKLEYSTDYMSTNRSLKLEGEAFFKVAKGEEFPFIVNSRNFQVKAIGTEFNISAYGNELNASAILKEGLIELSYNLAKEKDKVIKMVPGEKATINFVQNSIQIEMTTRILGALSWTKGELDFENDSMDKVFRKIERWYNVSIEHVQKDFANETLTVKLKQGEPIERLFQIIDDAMGISVKQTGNEYVINRK